MRERGRRLGAALVLVSSLTVPVVGESSGQTPQLTAEITAATATVGEPLDLRLTLRLPPDTRLLDAEIGPDLGEFRVLSGTWESAAGTEGSPDRIWRGRVAAYRTGELDLPAVTLRVQQGERVIRVRSEPVPVRIESVLDVEAEQEGLAGIKPPSSTDMDFSALRAALAIVALLLVCSLVGWWLFRRYGPKLAARSVPTDPFDRMPPHEWVYAALRELMERRLVEEGRVEEFYGELAWIVKRYLAARYRVDLMERTTGEVPAALEGCGAPAEPSVWALELLRRSDRVKFARQIPAASECRAEVEHAYRIVDHTRPPETRPEAATEGAA